MSKKTLIMFDFDGTIANTYDMAFSMYAHLRSEVKAPAMTRKEFDTFRHVSLEDKLKALNVSIFELPKYIKKVKKALQQFAHKAYPYEGIKEVIERLSKTHICVIVSSNQKRFIQTFLKTHHIIDIHKVYAASPLFNKDKTIKKVLKKYHKKPEEVMYVGDEVRDILACQRLGIDILAVSWGYDSKELLEKATPTRIIESIESLEKSFV